MEMPSGSPPSGQASSSPEHPTPAYAPEATSDAPPSPHAAPHADTAGAGEVPAGESQGATPVENTGSATTEQQPSQQGNAFVLSENPRPFPPPPPPLRYGEPRPAITPNRVGEPIHSPEPVAPTTSPRPPLDPNATRPVQPSYSPEPQPTQGENEGHASPPAGTAPIGTPLSPQPPFQPPQPPAQPDASGATDGATVTVLSVFVSAAAAVRLPHPPAMPRHRPAATPGYGGAPTYAPPAGAPASAAPAGYAPANALAPATPEVRPAGLNNRLLTIIAILLAALLLLQLYNALRPVRFDGAQPVQVQARALCPPRRAR